MRPLIPILIVLTLVGACDDCNNKNIIHCLNDQDFDRTENLGGIWRGTLTHSEISGTQNVVAIVTENDDFRIISTDGIQASGTITEQRSSATGTLRFFPIEGETFSEDRESISGTFDGSAAEGATLNGDWVASNDNSVTGSFQLTYDDVYAEDSSLITLAGNYFAQDGFGFSRSIVIEETGDIEGSDADGCAYSGTAATIDTRFNAYEFTISISDCVERSGDYSGLGFLANNGSELTVQVTGGTAVVSFLVFL